MFDIEDIRQARFMRFHSLPSTNNAEQLAQALVGVVEAQEQRQKARKVKDKKNFQRAVRHILADLLLGFEEEGNGWSFHPLRVASFTGLNVGYKNFKKIIKVWLLTCYLWSRLIYITVYLIHKIPYLTYLIGT